MNKVLLVCLVIALVAVVGAGAYVYTTTGVAASAGVSGFSGGVARLDGDPKACEPCSPGCICPP